MSSRRVKSLILQAIRELRQDFKDGSPVSGVDLSYSRGKSFENTLYVTALNEQFSEFEVLIVEHGGKKLRARERHMDAHFENGEEIMRFQPVYDEDGKHLHSIMLPCCDNEPSLGKSRIIKRWRRTWGKIGPK